MKENQTSCVVLHLDMAFGTPGVLRLVPLQDLRSILALVLSGWHQGDFSPFGVKSLYTVVRDLLYPSASHLVPEH